MTWLVQPLPPQELHRPSDDEPGFGTLTTGRGNLPLDELTVQACVTGLLAGIELTQGFRNVFDEPLEATYVFPLPDRAAVTGLRMEAGHRTVVAELKERGQARADYDAALAAGQRASIAEEERPDVFTMRVGNILPGERVVVRLTLVQPLPYADGEAEFRFPLVVAPRYVPGAPLSGTPVGTGWAPDTDTVPDASRITPPVLLPGLPSPVPLRIEVEVDPAGLPLAGLRSSLHAVVDDPAADGRSRLVRIEPGERADRDFVLRLRYGRPEAAATTAELSEDGTFRVTVLPPVQAAPARPRDVVLLLDRSGSMGGWKMVAARRAAARIVDTLGDADRFAVLGFDDRIETPPRLPSGLVPATDRHRYRAVEHLARLEARGGTELLAPLRAAVGLLAPTEASAPTESPPARDRVLVLVTDGQVGNEDQIVHEIAAGLTHVRVHVVGIDEAVNAGFLARLAVVGGGRCELVESEDRLDEAADQIHRRIAGPLLTGLQVGIDALDPRTVSPRRLPSLFPGAPVVLTGRRADPEGGRRAESVTVSGTLPDGLPWTETVALQQVCGKASAALTATWARSHLRDLEDAYAAVQYGPDELAALEQRLVATSLRFGVLCRFTAYVAVDERVVTDGEALHRVTQPVQPVRGWDLLAGTAAFPTTMAAPMSLQAAVPPPGALSASARAPWAAGKAAPAVARTAGGARAERVMPRLRRMAASLPHGPRLVGAAPEPLAGTSPLDPLREVLALELSRLREAREHSDAEWAGLLADLGTRLAVLTVQLRAAGTGEEQLAELESLVTSLAGIQGQLPPPGRLQTLRQQAIEVLDRLSAGGGRPGPSASGPDTDVPDPTAPDAQIPDSGPRPRTFWRR